REIYIIRKMLKPEAAALAAKVQNRAAIAAARATLKELTRLKDPVKRIALNRTFHDHVLDASGSPRLASIVRMLQDNARLTVAMRNIEMHADDFAVRVDGTHLRIVEALEAADAEAAAAATLEHLELTVGWARDS